ncbi:hypothetical protein bsdE14_15630 [Clostridium omnivorum]|uniref:Diguanylate cyclase n=2 Tax=Clostridium omnivorum TaxID=1604902 RepID=A0ABQ5N4J7_9CLOT|nr:hypothetical protein bsdE14_15630 [Clostridium sp. E14]
MAMYIDDNNTIFFQLIDAIPSPVFYKDVNRVYKLCNNAFSEYLGIKKENIINHTVYDISPKELADIYDTADLELIKAKDKQYYETQVKFNDGLYHDVSFLKAAILDSNGAVEGIVGVMLDITERKKSENKITRLLKLRDSMLDINHALMHIDNIDELLDLILEKALISIDNATTGCIFVLDEKKQLRIASQKGLESKKAENFTMNFEDSFSIYGTEATNYKTMIINDVQKLDSENYSYPLDNNHTYKINSLINSPIIIDEKLYGFLNLHSPINNIFNNTDTELLEYTAQEAGKAISKYMLYEQTIHQARYDKLTNLYNVRHFEQLFSELLKKSASLNENFLLVMFDLNGLKKTNDTYGHLVGDELLKAFSCKLSELTASSDILARLGGDEFIAIFFHTSIDSLTRKFEDLLSNFRINPIMFEENKLTCSFSYGFASYPEDGVSYSKLLTVADQNMYKYKRDFYKHSIE